MAATLPPDLENRSGSWNANHWRLGGTKVAAAGASSANATTDTLEYVNVLLAVMAQVRVSVAGPFD